MAWGQTSYWKKWFYKEIYKKRIFQTTKEDITKKSKLSVISGDNYGEL